MARRRKKKKTSKRRALSPKTYTAMLKRLARFRRSGKGRAWARLRQSASAYRKRMIAANRHHPVDGLPMPVFPKDLKRGMPPGFRLDYEKMMRHPEGRSVLARHKGFWRVPFPPTISTFDIGPKNEDIYLMGMGFTDQVHLADSRHGDKNPGVRKTKVKGRWNIACTPNGRQIIIFTGRKLKNTWKFVGYAPETHYIPTPELEDAGTPKKNVHWRHTHDDEGGQWPRVFADHGGRLGKDTNFLYDYGTYSVTDWIRR